MASNNKKLRYLDSVIETQAKINSHLSRIIPNSRYDEEKLRSLFKDIQLLEITEKEVLDDMPLTNSISGLASFMLEKIKNPFKRDEGTQCTLLDAYAYLFPTRNNSLNGLTNIDSSRNRILVTSPEKSGEVLKWEIDGEVINEHFVIQM